MELVRNHPGGLTGLVQKLRENGAGEIVDSWVGWEENRPIAAEQIRSVLGEEQVAQFAAKVGVSPELASAKLAELLPILADRMIPKRRTAERRNWA
jgi:uncharacterized protein YidB (DUF937 family)